MISSSLELFESIGGIKAFSLGERLSFWGIGVYFGLVYYLRSFYTSYALEFLAIGRACVSRLQNSRLFVSLWRGLLAFIFLIVPNATTSKHSNTSRKNLVSRLFGFHAEISRCFLAFRACFLFGDST